MVAYEIRLVRGAAIIWSGSRRNPTHTVTKHLQQLTSNHCILMAPVVETVVLVTGTDFKDKEMQGKLKEVGATWHKPMKGWILPLEMRAIAQKICSGEEVTEEDKKGIKDPTADPEPSKEAMCSVDVSDYLKQGAKPGSKPRSILVSGDTKGVKEQLVAMSGTFNFKLQGWIYPIMKKEQVLRVLRADPTNDVTEGGGLDDDSEDEIKSEDEDEDEDGLGFYVGQKSDEEEEPPVKKEWGPKSKRKKVE